MRALTVEELGFVSGGFGFNGPPQAPVETVVVPGIRRKPEGIDPGLWRSVTENEQRFQTFCDHMVGAYMNAQDQARLSDNTSDSGAMVGTAGVGLVGGGFAVCVGSVAATAPLAGAGGVLGCPAGATLAIVGATGAVLGGAVALAANLIENRHVTSGMNIRTTAIASGCPSSMF
jgi:hypothetical protein